jgi:hypothetical protein
MVHIEAITQSGTVLQLDGCQRDQEHHHVGYENRDGLGWDDEVDGEDGGMATKRRTVG